jgi:membrane protease YdiL (CAAX protease family)
MDGLIGLGGTLVILLLAGGLLGVLDRKRFAPGWLLIAALLVAINDGLLTRLYAAIPNLLSVSDWNWQGKLLAFAASLAIAALPLFGWRRVGLTLAQAPGSLKAALPVLMIYCGFFAILALVFPSDPASADEIAFQLTMPGLEEELFYRGILLLALDRAFVGRWRFLGVDWGWGAILSCLLFGLTHAFGYSDGQFSFDAVYMALTAFPSLIAVWLRLRTGSLLLPILVHNFGNSISMLI